MRRLLVLFVKGYRHAVSPLLGANKCRFEPSCSKYAIDALETHGAWKGFFLSLWRLLRCQPFCKGGYDPVPLPRDPSPGDAGGGASSPENSRP